LESFFGVNSPYISRRHHRDNRGSWEDDVDDTHVPEQPELQEQPATTNVEIASPMTSSPPPPQFQASDTENPLEAPTAALERLTQLTSEQVTNLQNASQQAGVILNDLKGTAEAGASSLLSNLENAQRQLAPEVQSQVEKIGTVLEKQVNEAQDVLMQAINAIKEQAEALRQKASSSLSSTAATSSSSKAVATEKKSSSSTTTELDSVAARFNTEIQQLTEKIKTLSEDQLKSLQDVLVSLEQELVQRAQQMRSFISEKSVEVNQTIEKLTAKIPAAPPAAAQKQLKQQQNKAPPVVVVKASTPAPKKKAAAVVPPQQKSSSLVDYPVQQLSKTAEAVKGVWQDTVQTKINKIKLPSVSLPAPIANFDTAKLKTTAAENPQAVAIGAVVLAVTAFGLILRRNSGNKTQAEQDAIQRARSRRRLERQRKRFKKALGNDDDGSGMIDSSVFAAVQRISKSSKAVTGAGVSSGNESGGAMGEGASDDDDDDEESGALGVDPQSWDPAMKKEWNKFVKSSKMKDANLWDPNEVDEGLPQIFVDLDRE
jgi:hypothetical protein